jgi:alkaline phosphatase D
VAVLLVAVAWVMPAQAGFIIASSDFQTPGSLDGWTTGPQANSAHNLGWNKTAGGNGYIVAGDDAGDVWYFVAPTKFLGDDSKAYGQNLTFDLKQTYAGTANQFDASDVVLVGGGLTLAFDTSANPSTSGFTSYSVQLSASAGWKVNDLSGVNATEAQMQAVLHSLTSLSIRGEYQTGTDDGFLDNVVLNGANSVSAVPAPPTLFLALGGMAVFGGWLRRQRRMNIA